MAVKTINDGAFTQICERANARIKEQGLVGHKKVEPTKRQWSKFKREMGDAYRFGRKPIEPVAETPTE